MMVSAHLPHALKANQTSYSEQLGCTNQRLLLQVPRCHICVTLQVWHLMYGWLYMDELEHSLTSAASYNHGIIVVAVIVDRRVEKGGRCLFDAHIAAYNAFYSPV